ncbi:VOC family protein [Acidisphaera sp. L21]|uniref:VOC family protein n=1 Tax=Acidisphaera sp. L21 TaxID=1641851 RepID=UPI00131DCDE6|nr:VOC family protein [Acidisphaera sp. L21]
MSSFHGHFVWHELRTSDMDAAQDFYCKVMEWTAEALVGGPVPYTRMMIGQTPVAGVMTLPPEAAAAGAPPRWIGYVGVDDVDAMLVRLEQAGGKVLYPATDIPTIGRFATVADPQGAAFALFQPAVSEAPAPLPMGTPGTVGWNELYAAEWQAAFAFYSALFGWQKGDAVDMGPMGTYQLFTVGGVAVGGMMTRMDPAQPPRWGYYVNVPDADAAVARINGAGGTVVHGPQVVPGGSMIVQGVDPQSIFFAVVSPPK